MGSMILSSSTEGDDMGSGKLSSKVTLRDSSILIVSLLSTMLRRGESAAHIIKCAAYFVYVSSNFINVVEKCDKDLEMNKRSIKCDEAKCGALHTKVRRTLDQGERKLNAEEKYDALMRKCGALQPVVTPNHKEEH
ncbi:hypothetical protein Tco_1248809 [Tanacetum coccineum]